MKRLRAGALQVFYENGFLRYINVGQTEFIRMIYFALRDENWTTYDLHIEDEVIHESEDSFLIQYNGINTAQDVPVFKWKVCIEGLSDGSIQFEIAGTAPENIWKNRAGLCVLHPINETRGQKAEIQDANGKLTKTFFPDQIDPENPFKNISMMRWQNNDQWYSLNFHGDTFETEDQRNWTDASFKTFCTPLDLPFPVELKKGNEVIQKVVFTPDASDFSFQNESPICIITSDQSILMPAIGVGSASYDNTLSPETIAQLKNVRFSHYRIDVQIDQPNWKDIFISSCATSKELDIAVELVVHLNTAYEKALAELQRCCHLVNVNIKYILLLTSDSLVTADQHINIVEKLRDEFPNARIGAGTDYNFTEINRHRFNAGSVDFISYSIHPQEHAFDNFSLIENLEGQSDTVDSARSIYPGKAIHISPVTLRRRFNPYATQLSERTKSDSQRTDPRQTSDFYAVWTLGSIKQLTEAGASALTYFQTAGLQGIISEQGNPYPVYRALQLLLSEDQQIISSKSTHPLKVDALIFNNGKAIVWNYTDEIQCATIVDVTIQLAPLAFRVVKW